jgi:ubiquinone/menaquinone biosynthesis C-methylase UbiE
VAQVDYDAVARTYQAGRSSTAQAAEWAEAIAPYLPPRPRGLRVLDLGAGTGIFSRLWPGWGGWHVVALDPSRAMLDEGRRAGLPQQATPVVGRGETLPLRPASVDVAWLSTVYHHLADPDRCVSDLARTLVDDGVVLVRSYFPDREGPAWFAAFPGIDRVSRSFPTLAEVAETLGRGGFAPRGVERVLGGQAPASVLHDWAVKMRHADTALGGLTDQELEAGLAALAAAGETRLPLVSLHVAAFTRAS